MKSPNQHTTTPTPLDRDATELHRALTDLVRVYQFRDRKRICCHDISVTQCYALDVLVREAPVALRRLAEALYLDNSTASRVMDSLERKGYARRSPDPADRRAVLLESTVEGQALYSRIDRSMIEEQKQLIEEFDPEVRRATAMLIARLARAAHDRFSNSCCVTLIDE